MLRGSSNTAYTKGLPTSAARGEFGQNFCVLRLSGHFHGWWDSWPAPSIPILPITQSVFRCSSRNRNQKPDPRLLMWTSSSSPSLLWLSAISHCDS